MLKLKIWYNFLKMYIVFLWPWDVSRGFYKDILFYCCSENERIASMRLYSNSVHLRGKNTGPETQLTEPTLMYISLYPFKFSTVCSHYNSSSTTSLILIWKGRQCYIVLHTFYIYLRTLLFTRMPILKLKKKFKKLMEGQNVNCKFFFWTDNMHWRKRAQTQIRPSSVHIPVSTALLPPALVFRRAFPSILKFIPNLLLNY